MFEPKDIVFLVLGLVAIALVFVWIAHKARPKPIPPELDFAFKPLSWFTTPEAKQSLETCMQHFDEMDAKKDEVGCAVSSVMNLSVNKDSEVFWPCRFFAYYIAELTGTIPANRCTAVSCRLPRFILRRNGEEPLKSLDEVLSPTENPVLKFLKRCPDYDDTLGHGASSLLNLYKVTYLMVCWITGLDCSDEDWLYSFQRCTDATGAPRTGEQMLDSIKPLAAHPENLPRL